MCSYYLEQQRSEAKEAEERRNREVERRMKPRSRADFELLYNELEAWRVAETRKIEVSEMSAEEKQQARYQLLLKEIKLVQVRVLVFLMLLLMLWLMWLMLWLLLLLLWFVLVVVLVRARRAEGVDAGGCGVGMVDGGG